MPKLTDVVDRSLFVAPPFISRDNLLDTTYNIVPVTNLSSDDLTSSPLHVEAYPARPRQDISILATPDRLKMENVYDRFLMTSGVRRNGKGYQSEAFAPAPASSSHSASTGKRDSFNPFSSSRRPMPPPVSSDDAVDSTGKKRPTGADELGLMPNTSGQAPLCAQAQHAKDDAHGAAWRMRRAFNAMVPGRTAGSRRALRGY